MTDVERLVSRNRLFAGGGIGTGTSTGTGTGTGTGGFRSDLTINPSGSMMVIGCVDPRVDPSAILGLAQGEAAIIRNVGGRLTPGTLRQLGMLSKVSQARRPAAAPSAPGTTPKDWNLVILHHTDCGMHDIAPFPDLLSDYFEIPADDLGEKFVTDPWRSVAADVGVATRTLKGAAFLVSGLVYDVATGLVEVVVPPTPLESEG